MTKFFSAITIVLALALGANAALASAPTVDSGLLDSANSAGLEISELSPGNDFGQQIINWISYGTTSPNWGETSLLSTVSLTLNIIALIVMAFLAVVGGATFVIQTANKGTPGGQVISSFWMPIRITTATILLIPLASGYSTLQYGVITIAEKGNTDANYLEGKILDYLYDYGVYRSPGLQDGTGQITSWLANEVCRQYINSYTGTNTINPILKSEKTSDNIYRVSISYSYNETTNNSNSNNPRVNYCGSVAFNMPYVEFDQSAFLPTGKLRDASAAATSGPDVIYARMPAFLTTVQSKVAKLASTLLKDEAALRALQNNGTSAQSAFERASADIQGTVASSNTELAEIIKYYNAETRKIVTTAVNDLNSKKSLLLTDGVGNWKDQLKEAGWPMFGAVFWIINQNQSEINKLAQALTITVQPPSLDSEWDRDIRFNDVLSRVDGAVKSYKASNPPMSPDTYDLSAIKDAGSEGSGFIDGAKSAIYRSLTGILKSMLFKNSDNDLILNMQYFGSALGTGAEALYWSKVMGMTIVKSGADLARHKTDSIDNAGLGLGNLASPITVPAGFGARVAFYGSDELGTFFNTLIIPIIIVGFTLGIVLPTIPLIQWLMGVISWMLFFIECNLVSPMWLAAHGTAEKEGWGSEHTRQGYMLMIGLYLNPILRVAGFAAIFIALKPIGVLTSVLIDYINGVIVSGFVLLFSFIGSAVMVSVFAYTAMVRIFSLPSELFERGLRWVNGGQEVTGDSKSEESSRHSIAAFSLEAKSAAGGAARGIPKSGPPPVAPAGKPI